MFLLILGTTTIWQWPFLQKNGDYYVPYVSYDEAVKILYSGQVKFVMQAHSLSVWMTLKNGTMIKTVEPVIDMIWRDYDRCGDPCKDTIFGTE